MPAVQSGVTYPRDTTPPPGLPAGWKAIERAYTVTSSSFGQTYIRYQSADGKHKHISSVNKAVELHAKDTGQDPKKAVERLKEDLKREKVAREREKGQGEDREVAVETFRKRYGGLEATTCAKLEGWTYKTSFLEFSGQTHVLYINEKEEVFGTLKQVEAALGYRMMEGQNLDKLVADARAAARATWGDEVDSKQFNPLRRTSDGLCLREAVSSGELAVSQLQAVQVHEVESHSAEMARRVVKDADYEPSDLVLGELPKPLNDERKVLKELTKNKLLDAAALAATVTKIYTNLKTQHFKKVRLVLVLTQACFHRLQKRGKKRRRSRSTSGAVKAEESEPGKDG